MEKTRNLEDFKINVKFKLSALWASLMFCYLYGDFFTLFVPGRIQNLMDGDSGAGATSPTKLLAYAILMTIPSLMVFLSLGLKAKINRLLNIILGCFYMIVMILIVATSHGEWMFFYILLGIVEIAISLLIIGYGWKWPKKEELE